MNTQSKQFFIYLLLLQKYDAAKTIQSISIKSVFEIRITENKLVEKRNAFIFEYATTNIEYN